MFARRWLMVPMLLSLCVAGMARGESAGPPWPNSVVVLGHSGATGESSDPKRPHVEVRANSWATGTNPAVDSVYLRILAKNPRIEGHNLNLAQGGATVVQLQTQAQLAVQSTPLPDLVLIQIMDNDMVCPARGSAYRSFHAGLQGALQTIVRGDPHATIFVVSQFGSLRSYAYAWTVSQRLTMTGTGPCDFIDPAGKVVPAKLAVLNTVIHGYQAQLRLTCEQFNRCHYDGDAFNSVAVRPEYYAFDLGHLSIKGHAKAAAVAWAALQRAGVIPRSG